MIHQNSIQIRSEHHRLVSVAFSIYHRRIKSGNWPFVIEKKRKTKLIHWIWIDLYIWDEFVKIVYNDNLCLLTLTSVIDWRFVIFELWSSSSSSMAFEAVAETCFNWLFSMIMLSIAFHHRRCFGLFEFIYKYKFATKLVNCAVFVNWYVLRAPRRQVKLLTVSIAFSGYSWQHCRLVCFKR